MGAVVGKPAREQVGLAMTEFAQYREDAGIKRGEIAQVIAVDALYPLAVLCRPLRITDTDRHGCLESRQRLRRRWTSPGGRERPPGKSRSADVLRVRRRLGGSFRRSFGRSSGVGSLPSRIRGGASGVRSRVNG